MANKTNKKRPPAKRTSGSKSASKSSGSNRAGRPGGQQPRAVVRKAGASDWIGAARIRTLPVALAPVALGTAAAFAASGFEAWHWVRALLCLAVALFLQIGVNYANDYSDGIRGTDKHRVGPSETDRVRRRQAARGARPSRLFFFLVARGRRARCRRAQRPVVAARWSAPRAIAAAWFYTGGKQPYGYYGLGEVFVFVFFGLVATAGTTYVQVGSVTIEGWFGRSLRRASSPAPCSW